MTTTPSDLETFRADARAWLSEHANPRPALATGWGEGSDSVALFHNLSFEEERVHIDALRRWQALKSDAGFGSITWEPEYGGRGLPRAYEQAYRREELAFDTPASHEAVNITLELVAPTIRAFGTEEQRERFVRPMRRADEMWCQLMSEPGAGSDLAALRTRAECVDDGWLLNGQKVWTSGAQYADFGYIICRTDPSLPKHAGMTAFVFPMNTPGVVVRPLRQMSGGASFNEVFLTDVYLPDTARLGGIGEGWRVGVTTLGFERASSTQGAPSPASFERVLALARHLGLADDPVVRQRLARLYTHVRVQKLTRARVAGGRQAGGPPGPESSIGKLFWTEGLRLMSDVVSELLGPRLVADSGEWGTYAWNEFVSGVPGYRIAAGSDEIQRNILAERVLGLPDEPRVDRNVPFSEIPY